MDQISQPQQGDSDTAAGAKLRELFEAARADATLISNLHGEATSKLTGIRELGTLATTAHNEIKTKATEVAELATQAVAAKTQVTDAQAVIATKSDHIEGAQRHADKVRAELDRLQTAATQNANDAEAQKNRAQAARDSADELLSEIRTHKTTADSELAAITALHDQAKDAEETTKALADKAKTIEQRIAKYEARLAELDTACAERLEEITKLLPGATAAGLAHSFDQRRQTFLKPATRWQWLFVGSVIVLAVLAGQGLYSAVKDGVPLEIGALSRLWLARLPIIGALVWLALHASREAALAKRLEEDYGYKAAVAASFQGFQKQMADVTIDADKGGPLAKLCEDTLATIGNPPGRIYDKHKLVVTPAGEVADAASTVTGAGKPT